MPVLKNAKHELFAQGLAKGMNAAEAYINAGYIGDKTAASRLSTNVNLMKRVEEIQSRVAVIAEWSAAERLMSLKTMHDECCREDRPTAIKAIAEANKMQGSHAAVKADINLDITDRLAERLARSKTRVID